MKTKLALLLAFLVTQFFAVASAQEVVIPDAALKSAIWETLGKPGPVGTLTEQDMLRLTSLYAYSRRVKILEGLGAAHNLTTLDLRFNHLTNFSFLSGLTRLTTLDLGGNQLTSLTLPAGLTSLITLNLFGNNLTDFAFLSALASLTTLDLGYNRLSGLTLPAELTSLTTLNLAGNPLQSFVLPEPLGQGALASFVDDLVNQGVSVSLYLPTLRLIGLPRTIGEAFEFLLTGPSGTYRIEMTRDFSTWTELDSVTVDGDGSVKVTDPSANARSHSFYRAVRSN